MYSPGNNVGNCHFLWRVPDDATVNECLERSTASVEKAKKQIPVFHSRAMRQEMFTKIGTISHAVKPSILRYFYKNLTGKTYH